MTQEALKLALDALENHTAIKHPQQIHYRDKAITAIKEALAQPEQEPVVWVSEDVCEGQYIDGRPRKIWWECEKGVGTAFYTTPPQRTWVGLNDDEIDYLIHLAYTGDEEFVQTIEAKLKEKNLPCIKPKWIGLTEKEHTEIAIECGCMSADWVFYGATVERKLKEKNT